jgi:uncharacterized protein
MPALPRHKTTTTDVAWDGPGQVKNVNAVADELWAWQDPAKDSTTKDAYSLPHHEVDGDGKPGAANVKGCTSAIGVLNGAMGGSSIPDGDKHGVWEHLQAHLQDAGMKTGDIPELKGAGRPGQSVRAVRSAMRGTRETRVPVSSQFELREVPNGTGGQDLLFTGFASTTGTGYEMEDWLGPWNEQVQVGAFAVTLRQAADVAFLLNHEGMTLARTKPGTLKLSEVTTGNPTGLHSEARLDPTNMYVQAMRSAVERGDLDEMSMAFRCIRDSWNDDFTDRILIEVSLNQGDVSLVNYGANGGTAGTVAMRRKGAARGFALRGFLDSLREIREGKTVSAASMEVLNQILGFCSDADDAMDQAQIILADFLSVPNPDNDDQWQGLGAPAPAGGTGDNGDTPPSGGTGPDAALSAPLVLDDYRAQLAALGDRR